MERLRIIVFLSYSTLRFARWIPVVLIKRTVHTWRHSVCFITYVFYLGIAARLEDVSDSVESAARRGDECFFQRMLANKSGRDSYKLCCQGEGRDPEDIARESGHPTLAAYLATNCPR